MAVAAKPWGSGEQNPNFLEGAKPVVAPAIDKVGPRSYHFRPSPTSGPTTQPGSHKSKISTEIFNMCNHMTFACYI